MVCVVRYGFRRGRDECFSARVAVSAALSKQNTKSIVLCVGRLSDLAGSIRTILPTASWNGM